MYVDSGLISPDAQLQSEWFSKFKSIVSIKSPLAKIIVGGAKVSQFTYAPGNFIKEIDYLVMGDVDYAFPQIITDLIAQKSIPFIEIGGRKIIDTIKAYPQKKDCIRHQWLRHWGIQKSEALPIEISRGCAFNCKFCHYDKKASYRKSTEDLRSEFIENFENYGTQYYHFVDDCFNDSRAKVEEVCGMIKALPFKVEWVSYARFDVAVKFPETADLMVESGARGLYWGVESLNHEVARKAGKGTPPEKIKEFIVKFKKKYGDTCYTTGSFISGLPGETRSSWMAEVDWLVNNDSFNFVNVGTLGIVNYNPSLDNTIIDYADYSRNPLKYGFEVVEFDPYYWRHTTMDSHEATELAEVLNQAWKQKTKGNMGAYGDIWTYPQLRSMGFSPAEIHQIFFTERSQLGNDLLLKGRQAYDSRLMDYMHHLKNLKN